MKADREDDRIVYLLRRETECGRCKRELWKGDFICLTGGEALCLECGGLAHLEYLAAGDTAVTRRATKQSGRVGRTTAAKEFDAGAVRLAVIAHVRHKYTNYEALLSRYGDRQLARSELKRKIEKVLRRWEGNVPF